MSKDKTLIDEIMEEIKHKENEYDTAGIDTQLGPDRQKVLDSVDAILSNDKKSAIVSDIEETTNKYTDTSDANTAVFERLKNPASDSPTMYFKRSRFQTKPLKFEETTEIIYDTSANGYSKINTEDNKSDDTVVWNIAKAPSEQVRSFKGQSVFDGRVNNQRSRMEFSQQIPERRRISKPGSTEDIFTTATIMPERNLSNTSTDDLAKIFNAGKKVDIPTNESQVVEGQIRLSGFDDEIAPDRVDDEFVAEQLRNTRLRKISEFNAKKIFDVYEGEESEAEPSELKQAEEIPTPEVEENQVEENLPPKKKGIHTTLRERYATRVVQVLALLVMGIFNALLFFFFPSDGSVALYSVLSILILAISSLFCSRTLISGVMDIVGKRFTMNSSIAVATLSVLIQNIALIASDHTVESAHPYQLGVIMIMLLHSWGKLSVEERIKNNFHNLSEMSEIYALSKIGDNDISALLGKGIPEQNPSIVYSSKVKNISKFIQTSSESDEFKPKYGKLSLVLIVLALIISIFAFIVSGKFVNAITVFSALTCCSIPAAAGFCANMPLLRFSRKNKKDGVILGYGATSQGLNTNAVAIDSCALFPKECCSLYGIKTFKNMPIDEAILLTTAALVAAENPLGGVFSGIIEGKTAILPYVEECNYEDGLGISAWIDGKRVLVGSRDMMIHRGIDVLTPQNERKYLKNNRHILYLAVENVLSALFVVSLMPDMKLATYIKHLQDNDITLLVRSTDPNLSEHILAHHFGAYESTFKILNGRCGEIYRIFSKATHPKLAASIVHRNTPLSMFKTLSFSLRLRSMMKTAFRVNAIGSIILFAVFTMSALIDADILISVLNLLILQLIVTALACIIPKFIKK